MSSSLPGEKESNYIESEIEGRLTIKLSRQPVRRLAGLARFLRFARSVTKGMVGFSALLGGPVLLDRRIDRLLQRFPAGLIVGPLDTRQAAQESPDR